MPYLIGLTGTIASGKSTAVKFFKSKGIMVLDADAIARSLTEKDNPVLKAIISHFGQRFLTSDGLINRKKLRQYIIEHPDEKKWLEALLHPKIRQCIASQVQHIRSHYGVIDIPLLTRREDFPYLNHVLLIEIDKALQIERLMIRDNCSTVEAEQMISLQPDKAIRRALADDIIQNNGDITQLQSTLQTLHTRYLTQASI